MSIPIKMEDFFYAEISIYSRAEFFIYLFEDFIQRFSNETPCPLIYLKDVRRFSTKHIKCRYLHEINEKSRTGINGYFFIKNPLLWKCHIYWICDNKLKSDFSLYIRLLSNQRLKPRFRTNKKRFWMLWIQRVI